MRRALQLSLAAGMLLALASFAAGPPTRPMREADQLDYAFLASDRPVLIRLHLRLGEKVYDADWHKWMDKLFAWFDKNNDGYIDTREVGRIPQAQTLSFQLQGSIGGANHVSMPMSTLDKNKDDKVSRDEFKAYFRNGGLPALRFSFNNTPAQDAKRVNEAIYKRLDRNGDGKLSAEEFARLPQLLRQLDEDEDELLTARELNTEGSESGTGYIYRVPRQSSQSLPTEPGLLELRPGSTGAEHVSQLMSRYDKNKDGKLARNEIALDAKLFDALDKNRDGFLDQKELPALFQRPPDLTFRVRTGAMKNGVVSVPSLLSKLNLMKPGTKTVAPERVAVLDPAKRDLTKPVPIKRIDGENVSFELGDTRIHLHGSQGQNFNNFGGIKNFYQQEFDTFAEKKDHVAKSQERGNQGRPFLFQIFAQADKNGDDKLTKKELNEWLDLVGDGSNCHVTLDVTDQGRSLFDVMDANGDGRLSIRETRVAWERGRPLCKEGKGGLTIADLPRTLRISAAQGQNSNQFAVALPFGGPMMAPVSSHPNTVPLWFRKMDRNNDGDVSPKEWLGTEEDFRQIDLDGDGLISVEEAKKYEARRNAEKK